MRPDSPQNWFLIRGLVRESADWGDFRNRFARANPGARVICVDLPGNGRHHRTVAPLKLSEMLDAARRDFRAALASEGIPGAPCFVLAISLGAMVTVEWLRGYPEELSGAVLINTSLRGVSPFYKRMSPAAYLTLARLFLSNDTRRREELILKLTSQRRSLAPAVLEERVQARLERPMTRANAVRQILAAAMSQSRLGGRPDCPVLLLNSLGDALVHPDCSERIRRRWNVPMKRHAWAGHDLTLDDPDWVIDAVGEWLATVPDRAQDPVLTKS